MGDNIVINLAGMGIGDGWMSPYHNGRYAEFLYLIYDGNFDIICNHSGVLDMLADMQWIGKAEYEKAVRSIYKQNGSGDVIGYLTAADSLRVLVVRNAGHIVPLSQPPYAQQMIEEFTS